MDRLPFELTEEVSNAVKHFWSTRMKQGSTQGTRTGLKDYGARSEATGGAQMDGFIDLVHSLLCTTGLSEPCIFRTKGKVEVPGWFRPEKQWDVIVVVDGILVAAIEFKSHIGPSFGNNFNNRTEEAIGNSVDILAAYREGAFKPSVKPWLGYLMLLEDDAASTTPVKVKEPHFQVFDEFRDTSYEDRYVILCTKLMRERLYDSACLLMSDRINGMNGIYREPSPELSFKNFATSLLARAIAVSQTS